MTCKKVKNEKYIIYNIKIYNLDMITDIIEDIKSIFDTVKRKTEKEKTTLKSSLNITFQSAISTFSLASGEFGSFGGIVFL